MSTNDFKCQQHCSEDYINSAHEFEVNCSKQNVNYIASKPCVQGTQDLEIVLIYDAESLT